MSVNAIAGSIAAWDAGIGTFVSSAGQAGRMLVAGGLVSSIPQPPTWQPIGCQFNQAGVTTSQASAQALTTNTPINIASGPTSLALTDGQWMISAAIAFVPAGTTSITQLIGAVSNTSATLPAGASIAQVANVTQTRIQQSYAAFVPGANDLGFVLPVMFARVSGTVNFYLVAQATFTVAALSAYGSLQAVYMRGL